MISPNKVWGLFVALFCGACIGIPACHAAGGNVAQGRPYTVTPPQNYPLSAPSTDTVALTDGVYTEGHFWTQKSTVGWQGVNPVEILIDLGREVPIGGVAFSTARGNNAGVYYPSHIAVFVGSDREHFAYAGDLAHNVRNQPGSYQVERFTSADVGIRGRFVLLEVVPKGFFIFCDEIEVTEGAEAHHMVGSLTLKEARAIAKQMLLSDKEKELLNKMADDVGSLDQSSKGNASLHEAISQISRLSNAGDADAIEKKLIAIRGARFAGRGASKTFTVEMVNPWAKLSPVSPVRDTRNPALSLEVPRGGHDFGAVVITNVSERPLPLVVQSKKAQIGAELDVYQVPFIRTSVVDDASMPAVMEYVADPLVPFTGSTIVNPGESRMLFLTALGRSAGKWDVDLHVQLGANAVTIPIAVAVSAVALPSKLSLNSVTWAYLDANIIRDRKKTAVSDLLAHHTNTAVIPPAYLPNLDSVGTTDYGGFKVYLKLHKGVDKVILFMDMKPERRIRLGRDYPFLSEQWKSFIKHWYEDIKGAVVECGFSEDQLYLYPFDEMSGMEIDRFIAFAKWARVEMPSAKFYATLGRKNSGAALPYLHVAQIAESEAEVLKNSAGAAERWLYNARGPAKSLSAYSYYRLMAWRAFLNDYKGIGFWTYADNASGQDSGSAWNDFDSNNPHYGVIYDGPGGSIISSRRWEGWRMGIEDYELLTMYARSRGISSAKLLVKAVLDDLTDTARADEVRKGILRELSR